MGIPASNNFLDKSWLFEIFDTRTSTVEKSFTLILPPNTVVVREPQRVAITKTFNNVFVDDYGPDNLEITIKAISGTTSVFPTYLTTGQVGGEMASPAFSSSYTVLTANSSAAGPVTSGKGYDGRSAFFAFRDDIMRYKDRGNFEYKELRVYDLFDAQAYKCILVDFTLERESKIPIWYPFTIRLFVYARMNNKLAFLTPSVPLATGDPFQSLSAVNTFTSWLQSAANVSTQIRNATGTVLADASLVSARLNNSLQQAVGIIATPLQLAGQLVKDSANQIVAIDTTYEAGQLTIEQYSTFLESAHATLSSALAVWGYAVQNQGKTSASETILYDNGLSIDATDYSGQSNDRVPTTQSLTYNGYKTYTVGGDDTLQRIALNEMGNESLWPFIALANSIVSNEELEPNSTILIPISTVGQISNDQYIVSSNVSYDPLGTDLALDSNGNILLGGNDLVTISGIPNLLQAINTRLQTEQGQMIKETTFGILTQVGNPGVGLSNSYAQMAIKASLIQDPRISQVENVNVLIQGDELFITADLTVPAFPTVIPLYTKV